MTSNAGVLHDGRKADMGKVFQCTECFDFAKFEYLLVVIPDHTHTLVEEYLGKAEYNYKKYMREKSKNGHRPSNTITQDVKIAALPASSQKTAITQTAQELDTKLEFTYKICLNQTLVITSPTKLSLQQMQELQKKFELQGYQVTELKYEGVFDHA